ncbi:MULTISPECIES: TauD/TfdA family dioxygenase [Nocardia]|uniref:TauD/TfdA family dioxygenase n=2 Tax=Nocardia TaxID=1817 RepID=UPI0024584F0B|nr:TauD/TfdA family dioxygenase [Nocardia abscessus]
MMSKVSGRAGTVLGEVRLSAAEADSVARLVDELAVQFGRVDDARLLRAVTGWGHRLPAALHEQLLSMKYEETVAGFVVRGALPGVDPGPTPARWGAGLETVRHDLWLLLVAAQLGDPVAWSVWQGGELVNDVLPMAGEATAQTGLGSAAELDLHVEEALYDDRCDGLALACLRNPDRVPTIVAATDVVDWSSLDVDVLFEPRYLIGDEESGRVRPALFGAADSPYLRVDMPYMRALPGDVRAAAALSGLCAQLRAGAIDVVLDAGDVLVLDNYRTVHGRRPFQPKFDGTDRWLRRCTTTRDLRATRALRGGVTSRVITPVLSKEES